jgi:hypothetical protein
VCKKLSVAQMQKLETPGEWVAGVKIYYANHTPLAAAVCKVATDGSYMVMGLLLPKDLDNITEVSKAMDIVDDGCDNLGIYQVYVQKGWIVTPWWKDHMEG